MREKTAEELKSSQYFCLVPWTHVEISHTALVHPCCRMDHQFSYGSLKKETIDQVWNSENAKLLRQTLLSGKSFKHCSDCYDREKNGELTDRLASLQNFSQDFKRTEETQADGSLAFKALPSLDIRFSNVCNFRCRICSAENSTSWYSDHSQLFPLDKKSGVLHPTAAKDQLWNILDSLIPQLERVYFAGGEPLLEQDHYTFLEKLITAQKTDVVLRYNTNFSTLEFGDRHIFSYWKQFKKIDLSVSLDGSGKALEYLRKGAVWNDIVQNIRTTRVLLPQVQISIMPTVSALNAFHIADAFADWARIGILNEQTNIVTNILNSPNHLRLDILNPLEILKLKEHYKMTLENLKNEISEKTFARIEQQLNYIAASIPKEFNQGFRTAFSRNTQKLDQLRNEKMSDHFPELQSLLIEN